MNRVEFYQMIGNGIRRCLPEKYRDYPVSIKETEISGKMKALMLVEKTEMNHMPVMNLEPYWDRVETGQAVSTVLVDVAADYARMISMQYRNRHRQMDR